MAGQTTTDRIWTATRNQTARKRRKTRTATDLPVIECTDGNVPEWKTTPPFALLIEATDELGECVDWLTDAWWSDLFQRWAAQSLTIRLAPTTNALLHPIVIHQLEMVRRLVANWRIVGEGYIGDLCGKNAVEQLATGPYHELQFYDALRPGENLSQDRSVANEAFEQLQRRIKHVPFPGPVVMRVHSHKSRRLREQTDQKRP